MSALTEAALLREVARIQRDKTLQDVRDLIDAMPTARTGRGYSGESIPAAKFRDELIASLRHLRDEP